MLKSLNIAGLINSIQNNDFGKLVEITTLQEINASRCLNIGDEGLKTFLESKLEIKSVNLSGLIKITDKSLEELFKLHNKIEEIDLSCLLQNGITDTALSNISKCKSLVKINIAGSRFQDTNFLSSLPNLVSVNLSNIQTVENSTIICLISQGVKIIRASSCLNLTNAFLETLWGFDKCSLLLLEINRTPKIIDSWIAKCVERFSPNLRIIRSTNLVWDPKNIGLKLPLVPIGYEKPILKGMKKPPKKKVNDKNPVKMLEKFEIDNKPKTLLDYYNKF